MDYSIAIAYYKFDEFRNVIDENPVDNPEVCKMTKCLTWSLMIQPGMRYIILKLFINFHGNYH